MTRLYSIEPKPTEYKGVVYRSQLESHWAEFFDFIRVPYLYEYKLYWLKHSLAYLPDFTLPLAPYRIVEIKPTWPNQIEIDKCLMLSKQVEGVAIFAGQPNIYVQVCLFRNGQAINIKTDWAFRVKCFAKGVSDSQGIFMTKLNMALGKRNLAKKLK